jgi:protein TonB
MLNSASLDPPLSRAVTGRALAASVLIHGACLLIGIFAIMSRDPGLSPQAVTDDYDLVFAVAGPGGGGGDGGNTIPTPPRRLEVTASSLAPAAIEPVPTPPPVLMAPVQTLMSALPTMGTISGLSAAPSRGPGSGAGAGTGPGAGVGGGDGASVGPGSGRGIGDGPMGPGSGATPPALLRRVDPTYTAAAMQARIRGTVVLEVLVTAAGTVTDVKVIGSLDKVYGLDQQAIATAKKWIFRPASFQGKPVAYVVNLHIVFNLY